MSADKDKWMEELRHKFDNYEEPASENLWKSIERDVNAIDMKRRMRRNVARIASIAACLALITGSYILLHNDGQLPETSLQPAQQIASTTIPSDSSQEYSATEKIQEEKHIATAERRVNARICNITPTGKSTDKQAYSISTTATEPEEAQKNGQDRKGNARTSTATAHTSNNNTPIIGKYARNGRVNDKQTGKRKFGVSVKVDNGFFAQNSSNGGFMPMDRQERPIFGPLYSSTKDEAEFNSSYAEMVASNTERPTRTDLQYDIPITASAMFRYNINRRWSVDAGLSFTRTGASWRSGSESHYYRSKQKAYFIGIPASINFTIFDSRYFSIYALAGGSVEKCVAGNISTSLVGGLENSNPNKKEDLPEHPWQFSISAGVGLQFNITRQYSLFAEPKAAYYFDTAKDILLRKDNTPQFNLSVGMRFNY